MNSAARPNGSRASTTSAPPSCGLTFPVPYLSNLLKSEQDRIAREITQAEVAIEAVSLETGKVESTLTKALELAEICNELYLSAPPQGRKWLNQIFIERIEVKPRDEITIRLQSPFREIAGLIGRADPATVQELFQGRAEEGHPTATATNCDRRNRGENETTPGRGWNMRWLVRPLGLEPRTCGLRVRRSAN